MHLLLKVVNSYRKIKILDNFVSVAKYQEELNIKNSELFSESKNQKEINYYLFEMKTVLSVKRRESRI